MSSSKIHIYTLHSNHNFMILSARNSLFDTKTQKERFIISNIINRQLYWKRRNLWLIQLVSLSWHTKIIARNYTAKSLARSPIAVDVLTFNFWLSNAVTLLISSFAGSMQWSRLADGSLTARAGHQLLNFTSSSKSEKGKEKMIIFGGGNNDGDFYNDTKEVEFRYRTWSYQK